MACRPASTSSTTESHADLLDVGRVTKAHGLRGEVVVQLWTDLTERLDPGSVLTTPRGTLTVERARRFQDRWIVQFEGIVDRSQAERMRGIELGGRAAVDDPGQALGARARRARWSSTSPARRWAPVKAVEPNPASDLLVLEGGGLIPLRFVTESDAEAGTLVVDIPDGLLDLT